MNSLFMQFLYIGKRCPEALSLLQNTSAVYFFLITVLFAVFAFFKSFT